MPVRARAAASPPADRGRLDIHARAVERIATVVARGVAGVVPIRPGTLGIGGSPQANAAVTATTTRVQVTITADWSTPLAVVARDVRAAVRSELGRQTGLRVTSVDIRVDDVRTKGTVDDD